MFCDWTIERYIRKKYYEDLNKLSPIKRFAEKFRLKIDELKLDIKDDDEIIGWFYFDKKCDENVTFTDEMQDKETKNTMNAPETFKNQPSFWQDFL